MIFSTRKVGAVTVNAVKGRVDRVGATELELILLADIRDGIKHIALDLSEVAYINSTGMRVLAEALTEIHKIDGDLRLVNLHPRVKRTFEIIGFLHFFKVYETIDAAVQSFSDEAPSAHAA
jgi:anti-anti-sigma factor